MYNSVFGKEDIKNLSDPCTGPDDSRRLRLPDFKTIST
jgi:hypothetical protein